MTQKTLSRPHPFTGLRHLALCGALLLGGLAIAGVSQALSMAHPGTATAQAETYVITLDRSSGEVTPSTLRFKLEAQTRTSSAKATATTNVPWLRFVGSSEWSVSQGDYVTVVAKVDLKAMQSLPVGTYAGEIEVTVERGRTVRRNVELVIEAGEGRVHQGLVALYGFEEAAGTVVHDISGVGQPLNLEIPDPSRVTWTPGSIRITDSPAIVSPQAASKVSSACKGSDEITLEAWVTPSVDQQSGPARIVTVSDGTLLRNATLGHGSDTGGSVDAYTARLRATSTTPNGTPGLSSLTGTAETDLQHVVYTRRSDGLATLYVDGAVVSTTTVTGDFSGWNNGFQLAVGNEVGANRPWSGSLHLVAIYGRALGSNEVAQNRAAGPGDATAGSLALEPPSDFVVFGTTGADLSAESITYQVLNSGTEVIDWTVSASETWVQFDGFTSGSLAPGASSSLSVRLDPAYVSSLAAGQYSADVSWTNVTNGFGNATTSVDLTLSEPGGGGGQKPGPHNTGPSDPSLLVPSGTITADVDGMVIENVDVNGIIRIEANNVTIRNFRINAGGNSYGIHCTFGTYTGTVMEDGEIYNVDSSALIGRNFTARRLNIHHSGGDGIKAEGNVLVEGCWIHHLGMNPGAHADGDQTRNGSNIVFRGNNIDMPEGLTGFRTNAAFIIQDETGPVSNFLIEGNWLNGGNYTIMLANEQYGGPSNITILNNRFGRDYRYGTLTLDGLSVVASGNVWDDTGAPMSWNNQ